MGLTGSSGRVPSLCEQGEAAVQEAKQRCEDAGRVLTPEGDEYDSSVIAEMVAAACSPTGRLSLSPAFGMKGTYWGVQVYDGRKKIGPYLVASEDEGQTPGGALRSLARLIDHAKGADHA